MQMNAYNLKRLFIIIQNAGVNDCYTEFTNHGNELGITVYFRMPKTA